MHYIGIKVPQNAPVAKCVSALRKLLSLSLSEIKCRIANGEYICTCQFVKTNEIDLAVDVYMALSAVGVSAECFEHDDSFDEDRHIALQQLQSWARTCHEIDNEGI